MIDLLNSIILWWHWIVLGILLIILELTVGTFFILIFAVGAILVGLSVLLIGLSFTGALGAWILFSIIATIVWLKYYKQKNLSASGQSNKSFDTIGTITKNVKANGIGEAVFDMPVLGNRHWHITAKEDIPEGSRVKIINIEGQLIVVENLD